MRNGLESPQGVSQAAVRALLRLLTRLSIDQNAMDTRSRMFTTPRNQHSFDLVSSRNGPARFFHARTRLTCVHTAMMLTYLLQHSKMVVPIQMCFAGGSGSVQEDGLIAVVGEDPPTGRGTARTGVCRSTSMRKICGLGTCSLRERHSLGRTPMSFVFVPL